MKESDLVNVESNNWTIKQWIAAQCGQVVNYDFAEN